MRHARRTPRIVRIRQGMHCGQCELCFACTMHDMHCARELFCTIRMLHTFHNTCHAQPAPHAMNITHDTHDTRSALCTKCTALETHCARSGQRTTRAAHETRWAFYCAHASQAFYSKHESASCTQHAFCAVCRASHAQSLQSFACVMQNLECSLEASENSIFIYSYP